MDEALYHDVKALEELPRAGVKEFLKPSDQSVDVLLELPRAGVEALLKPSDHTQQRVVLLVDAVAERRQEHAGGVL